MAESVYTCFVTKNKESCEKLFYYIKNILEVSEVSLDVRNGFYIISVGKYDYKNTIILGNRFIVSQNLSDVLWIDACDNFVKSGFLKVARFELPSNYKGNYFWALDQKLPNDIKIYLKNLKEFLGVPTYQSFTTFDDVGYLVIEVKGIDYEIYINKLVKFIRINGLGPFVEVLPMTEYGALIQKEDPVKKLYNKAKKMNSGL